MSLVVDQSVSGVYEDCRGDKLLFSCDVWVRECERVQIDVLCARQAKEPNTEVANRAAKTVMFNAVLGLAFLAQETSFHSLETCRRGPPVPCCENAQACTLGVTHGCSNCKLWRNSRVK